MSDAGGAWRRRSDQEILEAANHLDQYTDEGHRVIRAELLRRGIAEPPSAAAYPPTEPTTSFGPTAPTGPVEIPALDNLASLSDRLWGQLVDSVVVLSVVAVSALPSAVSDRVGGVTLVCGVAVALVYLLFADGLRGQSYGHRLTQTAVVHATTGAPCTFGQSFVRNLLLSALGVLDWVFIFGKKRQRLGDMAAKTIVIKTDAPVTWTLRRN